MVVSTFFTSRLFGVLKLEKDTNVILDSDEITLNPETSSREPILGEAQRLSDHRYTNVPNFQPENLRVSSRFKTRTTETDVFRTSSGEPILGEAQLLAERQ